MSPYVPYKNPQQNGMDYQLLMQMLAYKKMMEQGQQAQEQPKAPSASGMSDLLSSIGGGATGGAVANSLGSSGGGSLANSVFGGGGSSLVNSAAPDYMSGFNISAGIPEAGAGFLPTAGAETSALGSVAVPAAVAIGTFLGGRSGLNMLKGKQKNWKDASLADNAGRATLAIATGGLSEVGNKLFGGHKSTKERQSDKWNTLAKDGKVGDWFLQQNVTQDQGVDDKKLASGKLGGRDVWATSAFFDKFSTPNKRWDVTGTEAQREQIAKEILDNKLLDTQKGLTRFTDENAVQGIYDRVMGQKTSGGILTDPKLQLINKGPAQLPGVQDVSNLQKLTYAPARKDSPGFKDGKRINYGAR